MDRAMLLNQFKNAFTASSPLYNANLSAKKGQPLFVKREMDCSTINSQGEDICIEAKISNSFIDANSGVITATFPIIHSTIQTRNNIIITAPCDRNGIITDGHIEVTGDLTGYSTLFSRFRNIIIIGDICANGEILAPNGSISINGNVSGNIKIEAANVSIHGNLGEGVKIKSKEAPKLRRKSFSVPFKI